MNDQNPTPEPVSNAASPPTSGDSESMEDARQLVDDIDSFADELLKDHDKQETDTIPIAQDPRDQEVADDQGWSEESPLIQDGHATPTEEVVVNVDEELDYMEKLIEQMSNPEATMASGDSPEDETTPNLIDPAHESEEIESQEVQTDDAADEIVSDPSTIKRAPSSKEQQLDSDIEALLSNQTVESDEPTPIEMVIANEAEEEPTTAAPAAEPKRQDLDLSTLADVPLWKLVRIKCVNVLRRTLGWCRGPLLNPMFRFLDLIDSLLGSRFSPLAKEIIGYAALGTLAMTVVTLIVGILFNPF